MKTIIKINGGTGLDSHHAGKKAIMDKLVANYNKMKAPAILVPSVDHTRTKDGVGILFEKPYKPKNRKTFCISKRIISKEY